ncbi:hypothetical protein GGR55DRAFT_679457 [Xylaria sp. FL0064]|nr:hypothetical protein GGR55DRAFT_679457 [Xylaria sp. FL0064]
MMQLFILTSLLPFVTAIAQVFGPLEVIGSSVDPFLSADGQELVTSWQQHPNATRGVVFKPFELAPSLSLRDQEWTWRINISDFAAAVSEPEIPSTYNGAVGTHIVTTTYDFNWPGADNLSAEINKTSASFCLSVGEFHDPPVNVTNAYTEDDMNSVSCVSTLGQACVDAILAGVKYLGDAETQACPPPSQPWPEIPECQPTFGYNLNKTHHYTVATFGRGFGNYSTQNATAEFKNGAGWLGWYSGAQNGSGSVEYYTAMNRLHVAMINPLLGYEGELYDGFTENPQLLCMRVNATKLSSKDTNGDGVTFTSEAVLQSAGHSLQRPMGLTPMITWLVSIWILVAVSYHEII